MALVRDIIARSFRIIGVVKSGDSLPESNYHDAMITLNSMLDGWRNEIGMSRSITTITIPMVIGTQTYTIGASGASVTVAYPPVSAEAIVSAYSSSGDIDYQCEISDVFQWDSIPNKTSSTSAYATQIYFNPTYPNPTIKVYPVPSAAYDLKLDVWTEYTQFASLAASFAMPAGFEDATAFNLAIRLHSEYPDSVLNQATINIANETLSAIKRINLPTTMFIQPDIR